jgi:hypothetical protein
VATTGGSLASSSGLDGRPAVTLCSMSVCAGYTGSVRFDGMLLTSASMYARDVAGNLLRPSARIAVCYVEKTLDEYYCREICRNIRTGCPVDLSVVYTNCMSRRRV